MDISVIVPSYNARATIERSLGALVAQETDLRYEIICIDSSADGTGELIAERFPQVELLRSTKRLYPGDARNLGIARAKAGLLGFTDADCVARPDWIANLGRAHASRRPLIGGAVGNANPDSYVGCGYYFTEFNQWMPGGDAGFMEDIPTCCLSMKREAWEKYGPFIEGTYCSDTVFNWRVAEDGHRPYFDPAIRVDHLNPTAFLETLLHEPMHGRSFANVRATEKQLSRGRLLAYSFLAPLLPPLLYARAAGRTWKRPGTFPRFLATTPVVLSAMTAWSLGEFMGYLSHAFKSGQN